MPDVWTSEFTLQVATFRASEMSHPSQIKVTNKPVTSVLFQKKRLANEEERLKGIDSGWPDVVVGNTYWPTSDNYEDSGEEDSGGGG